MHLPDDLKLVVEKQSSKFNKILKDSLKIKDESVLVISDYGKDKNLLAPMMGYGYYHAAKRKKLAVEMLLQDEKKGFMQMDPHIHKGLRQLPPNSIIILTASNKAGRIGDVKSFRFFCREHGHRFISATGLGDVEVTHFDLFLEAMNVNYRRMKKQGLIIKKQWDKCKEIRIKTALGTDVIFDVSEMEATANVGEYHLPGHGGNMPAGEVYIPPQGLTGVRGVVVIDGSIKTENGAILVEEPVRFTIEDGRVIKIEGKYADTLEQTFQKFEDRAKFPERIRTVCEVGVGINPGAVLIGSTIMDEKVLGTAHIALGSNYWFGGAIKSIFHGDYVFKNPEIYVDGKKMDV